MKNCFHLTVVSLKQTDFNFKNEKCKEKHNSGFWQQNRKMTVDLCFSPIDKLAP